MKYLVRVLLMAAAYVVLARISYHFGVLAGQVGPIWLPSGVTLAALLLGGRSLWPGIALGSIAIQVYMNFPQPFWATLTGAAGEVLEPLVAWYLLRHRFSFRDDLDRVQDVIALFASSVLISIPLNATIGTVTLCSAGLEPWARAGAIWQNWWIADSTGSLVVAPAVLVWFRSRVKISVRRIPEAAALAASLAALLGLTFGSQAGPGLQRFPYVVFPILIWAALRFRQHGAVTLTFVTMWVAVWATVHNHGPFTTGVLGVNLLLLQAYLGTLAVTGLFMSAVTGERLQALRGLESANARLEQRVRQRTFELSESNAFLNILLENANVGITACDSEGRVTVLNRWMRSILDVREHPGTVHNWAARTLFYLPDGQTRVDDQDLPLLQALRGEVVRGAELIVQGKEPEFRRNILASAQPILDEDKVLLGAVAVVHDITDRKIAEEHLRHGARHDALTGLPNRAAFLEAVQRVLAQVARCPDTAFAVLFLDLDRFKAVNDTLGHEAGDQLLVWVAATLKACVRGGDLVSRLGGDEFTILLENLPAEGEGCEPSRVAGRILQALSQPVILEAGEVRTGTSIGIAIGNSAYQSPEEILRDADGAMYRAKRTGRGHFEIFKPDMCIRALPPPESLS